MTEQLLISPILPGCFTFYLKGGQRASKGHCYLHFQDVETFAASLPRSLDSLEILIVRKPHRNNSTLYRDFLVRRQYVLQAIQCLIDQHRYYPKVIRKNDAKHLPMDTNVFYQMPTVDMVAEDADLEADPNPNHTKDAPFEQYTRSFVPGRFHSRSESEIIKSDLKKAAGITQWPSVESAHVDEYTTEGYITMAFPTLFPTGEGDYLRPRPINIKPWEYFKHLIRYKDGRFAAHPSFPFYAMNSIARFHAQKSGAYLFKKSVQLKDLSVGDIKHQLQFDDGEQLAKQLHRLPEILKGSKAFWKKERKLLRSMISQIGCPTFFFTLSAADLSWPELHALLPLDPHEQGITPIESQRRAAHNLKTSPHIVAEFLAHRAIDYMKHISHALGVKDISRFKDFWYRFEWQHRGSGHIHGFLWLVDAPAIDDLDWDDPIAVNNARNYYDNFITAWNPALGKQKPMRDCLTRPLDVDSDMASDDIDYEDLCN